MTNPAQQYIDLYRENADLLGPRPEALEMLETRGNELPKAFAENYGINLRRLALPVDVNRSFKCAVPSINAAPALMVNDIFQAPSRLPQGVEISTATCSGHKPNDPLDALCTLFCPEEIQINIAAGAHIDKPLQLVNILAAPLDMLISRRLNIVVEEGASASLLICDHTQDPDHNYLINEQIDITLGPGASLTLDRIEESTERTVKYSALRVGEADGASLSSTSALLTCGESNNTVEIDLDGHHSRADVNGMVIASGSQRPAFNTLINHHGLYTSSGQVFKYVADGQSRCSFKGLVVVNNGAEYADAHQTNHNILASPQAQMHAEPMLEIYCDEVKCSHGATTGQLDADALFYMRSRGIPEEQARQMLMEAFLDDVIANVGIEPLRSRLRHLLQRRFSSLESHCNDCNVCL